MHLNCYIMYESPDLLYNEYRSLSSEGLGTRLPRLCMNKYFDDVNVYFIAFN
jgi:hypothetical protein